MVLKNIKNFSYEEIERFIVGLGEKPFRTKQIASWLYQKNISEIDQMTNISKSLRELLKKTVFISKLNLVTAQVSEDETVKYLFELKDNHKIESVLIKNEKRKTLCISTQIGCKMGCLFCNTAMIKFKRDLESSEILDQILFHKKFNSEEFDITNIVLMGMGEPLDNFDNVAKALKWMIDPMGLKVSARKITVSTCGIIPGIKNLFDLDIKVNLAVSLNSASNKVRSEIMPANKIYPLDKLIETCNNINLLNNRRITFEYIMIRDINDSKTDALQMAKILKRNRSKINLIPFNSFSESKYKTSDDERITAFRDILLSLGFTVSIRASKGKDVSSACGQLTAGYSYR